MKWSFILIASKINSEGTFEVIFSWLDHNDVAFACFEVIICAFEAALEDYTDW